MSGVQRRWEWKVGGGGCLFLKKGKISRRGDEKRNGGELIHLFAPWSNRNETKWSKRNLFAYLCFYKSPIRVNMTGNNNVHKTIRKNGNKEYNEKYICCFFTIWNLLSAIMHKCGRVVLFLTSVYFAIIKLILLFSYSFHVLCIILSNVYFYIVRSMFPFIVNWSWSKASVVNQMSHLFFFLEVQKYFFALFKFLKMVIFTKLFRRWSKL